MKALIRILRKVSPWKGKHYWCGACGRTQIHDGKCMFCGGRVE